MRRKLAVHLMFLLFGCAYATLDRIPQGAVRVLRGSTEYVVRGDEPSATDGLED
jgi:hypothetical protein